MPDMTYLHRWFDDYVYAKVLAQCLAEGRADNSAFDEESAEAAIEALLIGQQWESIADLYERATGWNPFKQ